MTEWKVLGRRMCSCHGGTAQWVPGERMSVRGKLVPCNNGLHICRDERDLLMWLGEVICPVVERSDEYVDADDKRACRWVVIGPPNAYWNERTARHFACDCAEYALRHTTGDQRELLQAIVDVTRAYVDWPEEWAEERDAAEYAAQDAVSAAAWAAERTAVGAAARAAARAAICDAMWAAMWAAVSAAESAVESAAVSVAAQDAAWAAARTTARAVLAAILKTYLDGSSEWVVTDKMTDKTADKIREASE